MRPHLEHRQRMCLPIVAMVLLFFGLQVPALIGQEEDSGLRVRWAKNMLTVYGNPLPAEVTINYLEAYCRAGSTDRDWGETVIPHRAELIQEAPDGKRLVLRDTLADGVVVVHVIEAGRDEVEFRVTAHNPTDRASQVHWAQPCMRVDTFTGCSRDDARQRIPQYVHKCFLFIDGQLHRLPTEPWADKARYVYGQVYAAPGVDRNDVNPRPLSPYTPSYGLTGCFSADEKKILAVAWHPYQEIFQGVITCLHSDFRIGGLAPGETKHIRGKLYVVDADVPRLLERYKRDFPEQLGQ